MIDPRPDRVAALPSLRVWCLSLRGSGARLPACMRYARARRRQLLFMMLIMQAWLGLVMTGVPGVVRAEGSSQQWLYVQPPATGNANCT